VARDRCDVMCLDPDKPESLRSSRLSPATADRAARRARAFGDATRLTLAAALADGDELCVGDLAWVIERAENLVSHHLRLLGSARLVTTRRDGRWSCTRSHPPDASCWRGRSPRRRRPERGRASYAAYLRRSAISPAKVRVAGRRQTGYLQGIDPEEIITAVRTRHAPMMSASAGLRL
jgi:ArsR family transcriptional regulator, lead/cadmium/zinc/bismuth-responsive transcriptional repressor